MVSNVLQPLASRCVHAAVKYSSSFLLVLLVLFSTALPADEDVEKSIFLVTESDRVIAVNARTGQFFDLDFSAKEEVQERFVADGVAVLVTNQRFAGVGVFPSGWSSLRRIADEKFISAEVADYSALVITSDRVLTFNGKSGAWSHTRR